MKRIYNYLALLCLLLIGFSSCSNHTHKIGVSQCYHNNWNLQLERDLRREGNSHPEIELDARLTYDGVQGQIADIRQMIRNRVDLIMVAPEVADSISPIINEAIQAGIPVILIDSESSDSDYTALVCVNNEDIGHHCAQFAIRNLGGHGTIIAMMGVKGSSNTADRHRGFREGLAAYPDIHVIDSCYTDWTYETAYPLIDSLIRLHPDVDFLACQSDPLAIAAHDACVNNHLAKMPLILGVDALMGEGNGIQSVLEGKISATCTNPTGSHEAIQLALDILEGRPYQRINMLQSQLIDPGNVKLVLTSEQRVDRMNRRIEQINGTLGFYFKRANLLQMFTIVCILLILMGIGLIFFIIRYTRQKSILRQRAQEATLAKLSFFTNVSHSFRTPLTLIADPIRTLLREGGLNDRQREMLELMNKNADELQALTDKVLSVLQDDLLKDGERLDLVALQSAQSTSSPAEFRNRTVSINPEPEVIDDQNQKTILIIDDNADIRRYLSLSLTERNFLALTAPNGEEGLHVAQQNLPDLIICDVMMPVMDGLECCRRLKDNPITSHIPVVMLTAYALDDQRIQGYQSGADAYITKPFNTEVLCARIANLLESRKRINTQNDRNKEMEQAEFSDKDRELVNHFHSYVTQHMGNLDLGVQQLCEEFNMSHIQLYRKCKSLTGQSPIEIIRVMRLKAATRLLQNTSKTVSEIAYETGFSSPSYFAKCYKDQYHESPTDVQRRAAEQRKG